MDTVVCPTCRGTYVRECPQQHTVEHRSYHCDRCSARFAVPTWLGRNRSLLSLVCYPLVVLTGFDFFGDGSDEIG